MRLNDVIKIFNVAVYTSQIKHAGYGTYLSTTVSLAGNNANVRIATMQTLDQTIQRCNVDIHSLCGQLARKFIFTILLSSDIRQ